MLNYCSPAINPWSLPNFTCSRPVILDETTAQQLTLSSPASHSVHLFLMSCSPDVTWWFDPKFITSSTDLRLLFNCRCFKVQRYSLTRPTLNMSEGWSQHLVWNEHICLNDVIETSSMLPCSVVVVVATLTSSSRQHHGGTDRWPPHPAGNWTGLSFSVFAVMSGQRPAVSCSDTTRQRTLMTHSCPKQHRITDMQGT